MRQRFGREAEPALATGNRSLLRRRGSVASIHVNPSRVVVDVDAMLPAIISMPRLRLLATLGGSWLTAA